MYLYYLTRALHIDSLYIFKSLLNNWNSQWNHNELIAAGRHRGFLSWSILILFYNIHGSAWTDWDKIEITSLHWVTVTKIMYSFVMQKNTLKKKQKQKETQETVYNIVYYRSHDVFENQQLSLLHP